MVINLTSEQRQAIDERHGRPVYFVDSATATSYVLVRADQFEKVKALFEKSEELDPRDAYPLVDETMRDDDANDPTLEHYQAYTRQGA